MLKNGVRHIMSLFSRKKKLIVSGCSYTADYAKINKLETFPIWSEILADKLDMEVINLARCGYGNEAIYHSAVEAMIAEKNVGMVFCMWSEWQRVCPFVDVPENEPVNREPWRCFLPEREVLDAEWHDQFYKPPAHNPKKKSLKYKVGKMLRDNYLDSIRGGAIRSLGYMYAFQNAAQNMDIKYLQMQGPQPLMGKVTPLDALNYRELAKHIVDSPYTDMFTENFIGFPVVKALDGFSSDWLLGLDSKLRISPEDSHPNKLGNEKIVERIFNEYEKIYSKN